jgi:hypothetical protein
MHPQMKHLAGGSRTARLLPRPCPCHRTWVALLTQTSRSNSVGPDLLQYQAAQQPRTYDVDDLSCGGKRRKTAEKVPAYMSTPKSRKLRSVTSRWPPAKWGRGSSKRSMNDVSRFFFMCPRLELARTASENAGTYHSQLHTGPTQLVFNQ